MKGKKNASFFHKAENNCTFYLILNLSYINFTVFI